MISKTKRYDFFSYNCANPDTLGTKKTETHLHLRFHTQLEKIIF